MTKQTIDSHSRVEVSILIKSSFGAQFEKVGHVKLTKSEIEKGFIVNGVLFIARPVLNEYETYVSIHGWEMLFDLPHCEPCDIKK